MQRQFTPLQQAILSIVESMQIEGRPASRWEKPTGWTERQTMLSEPKRLPFILPIRFSKVPLSVVVAEIVDCETYTEALAGEDAHRSMHDSVRIALRRLTHTGILLESANRWVGLSDAYKRPDGKRVVFLGKPDNDDPALDRFDVFVCPSDKSPTPKNMLFVAGMGAKKQEEFYELAVRLSSDTVLTERQGEAGELATVGLLDDTDRRILEALAKKYPGILTVDELTEDAQIGRTTAVAKRKSLVERGMALFGENKRRIGLSPHGLAVCQSLGIKVSAVLK